jgi:hypothetical protein
MMVHLDFILVDHDRPVRLGTNAVPKYSGSSPNSRGSSVRGVGSLLRQVASLCWREKRKCREFDKIMAGRNACSKRMVQC